MMWSLIKAKKGLTDRNLIHATSQKKSISVISFYLSKCFYYVQLCKSKNAYEVSVKAYKILALHMRSARLHYKKSRILCTLQDEQSCSLEPIILKTLFKLSKMEIFL
jgi:hypothetical protein